MAGSTCKGTARFSYGRIGGDSTRKGTARFIRSDIGAGSTRKGTTRFIRSDIGAGSTRKGTTRFKFGACIWLSIDSSITSDSIDCPSGSSCRASYPQR